MALLTLSIKYEIYSLFPLSQMNSIMCTLIIMRSELCSIRMIVLTLVSTHGQKHICQQWAVLAQCCHYHVMLLLNYLLQLKHGYKNLYV